MRWAVVFIGSLSTMVAGSAVAATPDPVLSRQALFGAAFATPSPAAAAVAPGLSLGYSDMGTARYVPGQGLLRLTSGELASFGGAGSPYVDSIRFSTVGYDPRLGPALLRPGATGASGQNFDLSYIRNWPQAFSLDTGRLTFDVTPHAGLGVLAGGGRTAEAGALVRLQQKVLHAVGMAGGSDPGHLYLFAGASGRAVGFNPPMHTQAAMGPDPDDGFVSESQAGVGFERGVLQASLGFSHQSMRLDALGDESRTDNRVGLTISIH
jgi:hypothetical protein